MRIAKAHRNTMTTQLTTQDGVPCPARLESPTKRRTCQAIPRAHAPVERGRNGAKLSALLL